MSRLRPQLVLFSALPFLLLSSANRVSVRTTVYLDGTVQRTLQADFRAERQSAVIPQLESALPRADREVVRTVGEGPQATRSTILSRADAIDGASLEFQDIAQRPLSLVTTYTWKERLTVPSDTATTVEKAGAAQAVFEYRVTMPGWVKEATAAPRLTATPAPAPVAQPEPAVPEAAAPEAPAPSSPPPPPAPGAAEALPPAEAPTTPEVGAVPPEMPAAPEAAAPAPEPAPPAVAPASGPALAAEISGPNATFALSAANEEYEITVTSWRIRWGYAALVLYVLAFIVYRLTAFLVHRAALQPRRI